MHTFTQHVLEQELQQKSGSKDSGVLTPAAQKTYINTLSETLASPGKSHAPMRVEDVIRKSEVREEKRERNGGMEGERGRGEGGRDRERERETKRERDGGRERGRGDSGISL